MDSWITLALLKDPTSAALAAVTVATGLTMLWRDWVAKDQHAEQIIILLVGMLFSLALHLGRNKPITPYMAASIVVNALAMAAAVKLGVKGVKLATEKKNETK